MEPDKRQFQLNLPGLLKVLAEHLYTTRKVAIRELLQNAHDSIVRREVEEQSAFYRPRIDIRTDPSALTITIQDNGAGMSDEDIVNYLTTIGSSYTREFGQKMEFISPDKASQLIGQFGLGFLSAFLVASEVTLLTRSRIATQGWRWHCDASEYYELAQAEFEMVGTRVELTVKPEARFLLEESVLAETVRQYADFLGVPIYVNNDPTPVNLMTPPWEAPDPGHAALEYIERGFREQNPICIVELHDQTVDLGHDTMVIPLKGFAFVPSTSVVSLREYGDLIVYVRRMFITNSERDLFPAWARFFRGVIDCPALQPTASRESIHQEDTYLAVQQALEEQLLRALRTIAREQPEVWKRIVTGHTDLVLGWVVANNEFFAQVSDLIPLRTSRGPMTMPDYLTLTNGTLYFVTREIGSLQEQLLGEGYEVPVIDASWFAVRPFLEKYASGKPGTGLVQMDGDARKLMRPVSEDDYNDMLRFYREKGIRVRVASFKPFSVPALMLYPRNVDTLIEARRALDSNELSAPFAKLVEQYLDQQHAEDEDHTGAGTLYLNASSQLIRQLAENTAKSAARDAALTLVYQIARLFAARTLTPGDAAQAFTEVSDSIKGLLS